MQDHSSYSELAIAGRWISLARKWLTKNTPCTREKMFVELGMLMPSHIRGSDNSLMDASMLVRKAYLRFYGTSQIPETISPPPPKRLKDGHTALLRELLKTQETVRVQDIPHIRHANAHLCRMTRTGECVRVSKGVYRLKSPSD